MRSGVTVAMRKMLPEHPETGGVALDAGPETGDNRRVFPATRFTAMDCYDEAKRSDIMSRIRSKDTKPELLVRKLLFHAGFRYRLHVKTLPGHPDVVLPRRKVVVFVHGCFWHGHAGCPKATVPATRGEFWEAKIRGNRERDEREIEALLAAGWRVLVVWQCACKKRNLPALADRMKRFVESGNETRLELGASDFKLRE